MADSKPEVSKIDKNDIAFLIALLTPEDRVELVNTFQDVFRQMYMDGVYSKTWYYKLLNGKKRPSLRVILEACKRDPQVLAWIEQRGKARVRQINELLNHR